MKTEIVHFCNIQREIIYYIGKNAQDNFDIIDNSEHSDIWFHIENESSCHVIAKIPQDIILSTKEYRTIIKKGALLCKENTSKCKKIKNISIVYTFCKNVKKTDIIGCVETQNTKKIEI